jgi:hypothetical protein
MTRTAIGLFDGFAEAQRLIPTLVAQGIQSENITIIANERNRFESSYAARFKRSVGLYVAWRP